MAGTFCSLLAGTLVGMHQLGFALAFGVLLDTFVVRPILVPAFLIMLYEGRFASLKNFVGSPAVARTEAMEEAKPFIEPKAIRRLPPGCWISPTRHFYIKSAIMGWNHDHLAAFLWS